MRTCKNLHNFPVALNNGFRLFILQLENLDVLYGVIITMSSIQKSKNSSSMRQNFSFKFNIIQSVYKTSKMCSCDKGQRTEHFMRGNPRQKFHGLVAM